jgi:regulatory protein
VALGLLGRRDYTAVELRDKLLQRGHSIEDVTSTIEELRVRGIVDDRRVAAAAVRTAARVKGRGRVRIARDLEARGVERALVQELLATLAPEDEAEAIARILSRKHWPARPTLADRRRMFQHLLRRGFPAEAIAKALRQQDDTE